MCVCGGGGGIINNHECVTLHSIASYVLYIYPLSRSREGTKARQNLYISLIATKKSSLISSPREF